MRLQGQNWGILSDRLSLFKTITNAIKQDMMADAPGAENIDSIQDWCRELINHAEAMQSDCQQIKKQIR